MSTKRETYSALENKKGGLDFSPSSPKHHGVSFGIELGFAPTAVKEGKKDPHPTNSRQEYGIIGAKGKAITGIKLYQPPFHSFTH